MLEQRRELLAWSMLIGPAIVMTEHPRPRKTPIEPLTACVKNFCVTFEWRDEIPSQQLAIDLSF